MDLLKGENKEKSQSKPRALFLFPDRQAESDTDVCSGSFPSHLEGKPCPFSDHGRLPDPRMEFPGLTSEDIRRLELIEIAPACVIQDLGALKTWQGRMRLQYTQVIEDWHLFKCRQMFLLVIPGISPLPLKRDHQ